MHNFFIIIFLSLLPSFIWFYFFSREDLHPEPAKKVLLTFLFGIFFSFFAFFLENHLQKIVYLNFVSNLIILGIAIIEEGIKFLAAFLANEKSKDFDEPMDAMIYMISAALGFAAVENFFIITNEFYSTSSDFFGILNILSLRFVGATLLHVLSSAILGYYWALSHFAGRKKLFFLGFLFAILIHFIFNVLVIQFGYSNIFYNTLILIFIAFLVFVDFEKLKKQN